MAKSSKNVESYLDQRSKEILKNEKKPNVGFAPIGKFLTGMMLVLILLFLVYPGNWNNLKQGFQSMTQEIANSQPEPTLQPTPVIQTQQDVKLAVLEFDKNTRFAVYPSASEFYSNPNMLVGGLNYVYAPGKVGGWTHLKFATPLVRNNGEGEAKDIVISMEILTLSTKVSQKKDILKPKESWIAELYPEPTLAVLDVKTDMQTKILFTLSYNNGRETINENYEMPFGLRPRGQTPIGSPAYDFKTIYYVTPTDPTIEKYMCKIQKSSPKEIKSTLNCIWDKLSDDLTYQEHAGKEYYYPSQTIKNGGGACRDSAILFSSIIERMAINSKIVHLGLLRLEEGHAITGYYDGLQWNYIETTIIGRYDFDAALKEGRKLYEEAKQSSQTKGTSFYELEPQFFWQMGIKAPPEVNP